MTIQYNDALDVLFSTHEVEVKYLTMQGAIRTFTCRATHNHSRRKLDHIVTMTLNGYPTGEKRQIYLSGLLEINKKLIIK